MFVVFSPIFLADTKITFIYNFVAPLKNIQSEKGLSQKYVQITAKSNW